MAHTFALNKRDVSLTATIGQLNVVRQSGPVIELTAEGPGHIALQVSRTPGERLVGLGEQFGALEQSGRRWKGRTRDLVLAEPRDTYYPLPLVLSSAGYGLLLETQVPPVWDLRGTDEWLVQIPCAALSLHLFRGTPRDILVSASAINGRPPVPAPWLLGVWKTLVGGTESALRTAERMERERLPVSASWIYDHYDEPTNSGCGASGSYARGPYPDVAALTAGLHGYGHRVLGYVQPCLYDDSAPYREAERNDWLIRNADGAPAVIPFFNPKTHPDDLAIVDEGGAYVDLSIPEATRWYQSLLGQVLDQGFDGWMQDMGEHVPDEARYADGESGNSNRYPMLYHRAAHEVWSPRPDAGIFARSSTLGAMSYLPAMWPGDQHCDWRSDRGLRSVLPAGPSAGLAGVGAWGPDIAGILDGENGGSQDEELWIRWCQYGALTPIMRDHLGFKMGGTPVDLFASERTRATWRRYADLHLRLYPYLQALAEETSATGIPMVRALLLDYPEHDEAWTIPDQYLLGSLLLVAPVHEKGARSRRVWFPPGDWVSWWEGSRHSGPGWDEAPAPLEQIPLFQKDGTTVPLT